MMIMWMMVRLRKNCDIGTTTLKETFRKVVGANIDPIWASALPTTVLRNIGAFSRPLMLGFHDQSLL